MSRITTTHNGSLCALAKISNNNNNNKNNQQILYNADDDIQTTSAVASKVLGADEESINKPTKKLTMLTAKCAQQSKLTTICKIITPRKCHTQQQQLQQRQEQTEQQVEQQQRSLTQTTVTTIVTTSTTTTITTSAGNVNVKSNVNLYANASVSNKSTRTENKYLPAQLTAVSNERELKVCATSALKQVEKIKLDGNTNYAGKQRCQQQSTDYAKGLQSGLQLQTKQQQQQLNLFAERKAKLRAEFFATHPATGKSKGSNYLLKRLLQDKTKYTHCEAVVKKYNSTFIAFPKVQELVRKFDQQAKMIINIAENGKSCNSVLKPEQLQQQQLRQSPLSDEGCNLAQSPYCSSDEDNDSICTASTAIERIGNGKRRDKVARSASSDSALGLEVDEPIATPPTEAQQGRRRMTLTVTDLPLRPALLPLAEPTALPDTLTPTETQTLITQSTVPSKVLLEERVVELPVEETLSSIASSRRESAQSCLSDYPLSECSGVRYMRTPSVVVSDYSDDVMCGITLEEIEYFRAQRNARRCSSFDTTGNEKDAEMHSDVSAASSCSNLYYCGSTISALDGAECFVNGVRVPLERKSSDSSNYSVGGENDETTPTPQNNMDLCNLLAAQHLDNQSNYAKKVGLAPTVVVSQAEN